MRPLTVLILILGAVAALVFAIVSISGDRQQHGTVVNKDLVVRPAEDTPETAQLAAPREIVGPAAALPAGVDRSEVRTDPGSRGAYIGSIAGVVLDPKGQPIAEARVHLLDVQSSEVSEAVRLVNNQDPPKPRAKLVTDATGSFRFGSLPPGNWTIVVTHDLFDRYEANGIQVPEDGTVEEKITLEYGLSVQGYVTDAASGAPIEGAVLRLDNPLAAFLPSARRSAARKETKTDGLGFFGFRNTGGGQKTLIISADGYATQVHNNFGMSWGQQKDPDPQATGSVRTALDDTSAPENKNYELEPGMTIAGHVVGPNGEGITGVQVEAINQTGTIGSRGVTSSKAGGEFLIENIGEGFYTVRATAKGFSAQPLQRVETGRTNVQIVLAEQGRVRGKVVVAASGKPVHDFVIKVRALHPRNPSWGNVVASRKFHDRSNGAFDLKGIRQGDYVIEGSARGFASSFSQSFAVAEGQETGDIVVHLTQGGKIQGVVIDSYTGEPVVGAEVKTQDNNYVDTEFFNMLASLNDSASTKTSTRTGKDGAFELELMTPDTYQIQIVMSGYSAMTMNNIVIGDGQTHVMGKLELTKGAIVRGRVYGPDGLACAGATVWMSPTDNNPWGSRQARTDANGDYLLKNAVAGTYKLHASRSASSRGNPFSAVVDMRNSEIEISLVDNEVYEQDIHMGGSGSQ